MYELRILFTTGGHACNREITSEGPEPRMTMHQLGLEAARGDLKIGLFGRRRFAPLFSLPLFLHLSFFTQFRYRESLKGEPQVV